MTPMLRGIQFLCILCCCCCSGTVAALHVPMTTAHQQPDGYAYVYGSSSVAGTDPDRPSKVNQDRAFLVLAPPCCTNHAAAAAADGDDNETSDCVLLLGVLDGHGREGHVVTEYLQERLPYRLQQQLGRSGAAVVPLLDAEEEEDATVLGQLEQQTREIIDLGGADPVRDLQCPTSKTGQALIDAFVLAHLDARRADGIPTGRSGTTAVVCCSEHNDRRLVITTASVGDSRAFVLPLDDEDDTGTGTGTELSPLEWLIPTTTTQDPSERARIERCQGRIDASGNVFYGPVGIAMTRSLGNAVMLRAGVLPVPTIATWETVPPMMQQKHRKKTTREWLVGCCTDGISDVFRDADVLATVIRQELEKEDDLSFVARRICDRARQAWLADLPIETKVDDCTITLARVSLPASKEN